MSTVLPMSFLTVNSDAPIFLLNVFKWNFIFKEQLRQNETKLF